ncbi:PspC domain-containing protein [Fulvivirga lutea]|uniref:PspC domain-containing protein n=1 Tax=Fulvivirga lutea TaxID=2810512 RepID=A0A974WEG5_9BACT|nr:PspC domain-containing protein [Fulvivirga lutea]QSE96869.1 PspC domain-containing protein [Fulvivirga lutea]
MSASRLTRSKGDAILAGVCSGLAKYFGWDPVLVRILFVILTLVGVGSPILVYLILWIVMPSY